MGTGQPLGCPVPHPIVMAIYEIRFLSDSRATLLVYVTVGDTEPVLTGKLEVAEELPYTSYEIVCGRQKLREGLRYPAGSATV